jgi:hypothetical protein
MFRSSERFSSNSTTKKADDGNANLFNGSANSLDSLFLHFKYLTSGPIHIQELCYKTIERLFSEYDCSKQTNRELQAVKLGVNIWWDLYCELKDSK